MDTGFGPTSGLNQFNVHGAYGFPFCQYVFSRNQTLAKVHKAQGRPARFEAIIQ